MKILVTGGAGFIGSHIVDALISRGYDVSVVDSLLTGKRENLNSAARFYNLDLCDDTLPQLVGSQHYHYVIHQAAQVNVRFSVDNPAEDARSNILGTLNLLRGCLNGGIRGLLFASSGGAIYGQPVQLPVQETHSKGALSPYGVGKLSVEHYLYSFASMFELPYIALRYGNVYGPRQDSDGESGVVAIFGKKLLMGQAPIVFGDGEQTRDYIYVQDVVQANLLALQMLEEQYAKGKIYGPPGDFNSWAFNIGSGRGISVNKLLQYIREITDYSGAIQYGASCSGDLREIYLDVNKARTTLGWEAKVDIIQGLKYTLEYLQKHWKLNHAPIKSSCIEGGK